MLWDDVFKELELVDKEQILRISARAQAINELKRKFKRDINNK